MADSKTKDQRGKQAQKELREKLRLEKPLAANMLEILEQIATDAGAVYAESGTVISVEQYTVEIEDTLRTAYRYAAAVFGSILADDLRDVKDDHDNVLGAELIRFASENGMSSDDAIRQYIEQKNAAISGFIDDSAVLRTAMIQETNAESVRNAIASAVAEVSGKSLYTKRDVQFDVSRKPVSREQIQDAVFRAFMRSDEYRAKLIAATEIQNAAEGSKQIAASMLEKLFKPRVAVQVKEWRTVGDDKVRDAHASADFQVVNADKPFIVGGQRLMMPGDSSLGATPDNTINCRCSGVHYYSDKRRSP